MIPPARWEDTGVALICIGARNGAGVEFEVLRAVDMSKCCVGVVPTGSPASRSVARDLGVFKAREAGVGVGVIILLDLGVIEVAA